MGVLDIFKVNEYKSKIAELESQISNLQSVMTPEMTNVVALQKRKNELDKQINTLLQEGLTKRNSLRDLDSEISKRKDQIIQLDDEILLQSFGLYEPKYDFVNSEEYKKRLQKIRQKQKDMIKTGNAASGNVNWTVNGSKSQGQKMLKDMQKLLIRAFNNECDMAIENVKYNTFDTAKKRITSSCEAISKLGKIMQLSITNSYYNAKIEELTLALEYRIKKQEEKELQRELNAKMREEAKLQKEIEQQRKKIEKEQSHYQNALSQIISQLDSATDEEKADLLDKKAEIENNLDEIEKSIKDIDYREANQRAGYVYVISNIGSFGEDIYKIGMTRRLNPAERVDELGDASVPFDFDIHAMIFSDDAPALETALHKAFENRKVNMVNQRREFFNVTLAEIKQVVKENFDKTVEFIDVAEAEQYRISQKMKELTK